MWGKKGEDADRTHTHTHTRTHTHTVEKRVERAGAHRGL